MADYPVSVKTELGTFSGTIDIEVSGPAVSGSFSIMGFTSSFTGLAEESRLSFSGSLTTPVGELSYNAEGILSEDGFSGIAKTRVGDFEFAPPYHVRRKRNKTRRKI